MEADADERGKRAAGRFAVDAYVRDGTCIGLGTGSTARFAIDRVVERVRAGEAIRVVATSQETARRCRDGGVEIVEFGTLPIDVDIDGADEVAPDWSLVKGGGGALFREKAVAIAAERFVVVVTPNKLVERLGRFRVPIEIVPFTLRVVMREIEAMGATVTLRRDASGKAVATDNANALADADFGLIEDPRALDAALRTLHGVLDTGIFVGLTTRVVVGEPGGSARELAAPAASARA